MNQSAYKIFSDSSININLNPLNIYVLLEPGTDFKDIDLLKTVGRRKTVTGNVFSIRTFRKYLVVGGESRKPLRDAIGDANVIAEIFNTVGCPPRYICAKIDYNKENINETSSQLRDFVINLCENDIAVLNDCGFLPPERVNGLISKIRNLEDYLSRQSTKSQTNKDYPNRPIPENECVNEPKASYQSRLSTDKQFGGTLVPLRESCNKSISKESKSTSSDVSFSKEDIIRVAKELGWDYDLFINRLSEHSGNQIINSEDISLRIVPKISRSRTPGLEFTYNDNTKVLIKIGSKAGAILYGSILACKLEGKRFKRSDLIDVVNAVKQRYASKGNRDFTKDDYHAIPMLSWFRAVYKAVLGGSDGAFINWCIDEYNNKSISDAASLIRTNILDAFLGKDMSVYRDKLLIKKKARILDGKKTHYQDYTIDFPVDKVNFQGEGWEYFRK